MQWTIELNSPTPTTVTVSYTDNISSQINLRHRNLIFTYEWYEKCKNHYYGVTNYQRKLGNFSIIWILLILYYELIVRILNEIYNGGNQTLLYFNIIKYH